jgi:UDP-GlcNAc:undecaprenyl-phosphate/decaprenyl-phosphate GlcNAc-1-phosphate transferase
MQLFFTLIGMFVALLAVAYGTNEFLLKNANKFGANKGGNQPRWASAPKPPVGGMSFYAAILVGLAGIFLFTDYTFQNSVWALFLPVSVGFFVGLADDSYNTPPTVKFFGQFLTAFLFISFGLIIPISGSLVFNIIFTAIWVVGIMNSVNMLDNMDGIVSCVSLVALSVALFILSLQAELPMAELLIIVGLMGALVGFLVLNWAPAKVYMGDTGSQFLGAFLAWVSIQYFWQYRVESAGGIQIIQFLVPALAFIVPLMDTTTVTTRRILRGVSPFVGGRDHLTHHLAYLNLADKSVVRILTSVGIVAAFTACCVIGFGHWGPQTTGLIVVFYGLTFVTLQLLYNEAKERETASKKQQQSTQAQENAQLIEEEEMVY